MALSRAMRSALVALSASAVSAEQGVQVVTDANEAPSTLPPYDCDAEYDVWKTAWTPDWKEWCCQNEQRGCPSTTTTTATSSTATTTTRTATTTRTSTSTVTTSTTEEGGSCDTLCEFKGVNATCADRVRWAASHDTKDEKNACEAAHVLVVSQCSMCGSCSPKAASCDKPSEEHAQAKKEKKMTFRKKFEEPAVLRSQIGSESSTRGAGLGFFARCSLAGIAAGVPLAIVLRRSLRSVSAQPEPREQSYQRTDARGDEEEAHE